MDDKELLADSITKGLAYEENGGKLNLDKTAAGKSGEMKSIFQFTPDTWANYSQQVYGKLMPLNNDNEAYVVKQKVLKWIDEGKTTSQIASMWNAGENHPDAYKENWRGTNSHGVKYDTPTYAANVLKYAKQFYQEKSSQPSVAKTIPQQTTQQQPTASPLNRSTLPANKGLAGSLIAAKSNPSGMSQTQ